jgi:hypothetical protein
MRTRTGQPARRKWASRKRNLEGCGQTSLGSRLPSRVAQGILQRRPLTSLDYARPWSAHRRPSTPLDGCLQSGKSETVSVSVCDAPQATFLLQQSKSTVTSTAARAVETRRIKTPLLMVRPTRSSAVLLLSPKLSPVAPGQGRSLTRPSSNLTSLRRLRNNQTTGRARQFVLCSRYVARSIDRSIAAFVPELRRLLRRATVLSRSSRCCLLAPPKAFIRSVCLARRSCDVDQSEGCCSDDDEAEASADHRRLLGR